MDGDGWTQCGLGHRHWGLFGAAGLLVVRPGQILLQLRAAGVHHGGTWSIPGGARTRDETPIAAALRESWEEIDLPPTAVEPRQIHLDDHDGWSYATVVALLVQDFAPRHNHESQEARWVGIDDLDTLPLHHGFARSWPVVAEIVAGLPARPDVMIRD